MTPEFARRIVDAMTDEQRDELGRVLRMLADILPKVDGAISEWAANGCRQRTERAVSGASGDQV